MPLDTSASEVDIVFSCVSIFQLISSLPRYPPREHNLYLPLPIPFQMLFFVFELFFVYGPAHAPRH